MKLGAYLVFQVSASIIRWRLKSLETGSSVENGFVILGTFKAITKNPATACKVSRRAYEHEALMHSHGYFSLGNAKDRCDFKGL